MNNDTPNSADQTIQCRDCQQSFAFTAGEQTFYAEMQFSVPVRCKACRQKRKQDREARDGGGQAAPLPQALPAFEEGRGGGGGRKARGRRGRDQWDD